MQHASYAVPCSTVHDSACAANISSSTEANLLCLQCCVQLSAERAKADHAVSESSLRESSAAEVAGLRQQLDDTRREAAVARAKTDAMQRDKKVHLHDSMVQRPQQPPVRLQSVKTVCLVIRHRCSVQDDH